MIYYDFKFIQTSYSNSEPKNINIYRFKTRFNRVYLVNAEFYPNEIVILKFYLKQHNSSVNKYKILINDFDTIRILNTILQIAKYILIQNPKISFGFIGENSINEFSFRTKRYKLYSKIAAKNFNPDNFSHNYNDEKSAYFLINKKNISLRIEMIENQFDEYYDF
jgi:hypothetical protein